MPATSLPAEIRELMTTSVGWEQFLGFTGHAEPTYAALVNLVCWTEERGTSGGVQANRKEFEAEWEYEPRYDLYFDGDDANAQSFTLNDRFTPGGIAAAGIALLPIRIAPFYGPNFDNANPWLILVTL